jgi:hypothetical protein
MLSLLLLLPSRPFFTPLALLLRMLWLLRLLRLLRFQFIHR